MTNTQLTEAVNAGMRGMHKQPSAFLFVDGITNWTCDTGFLCGLPVFHACGMACSRWGTGAVDCPVIPIGRTDTEITYQDRRLFADAFEAAVTEGDAV